MVTDFSIGPQKNVNFSSHALFISWDLIPVFIFIFESKPCVKTALTLFRVGVVVDSACSRFRMM